MCGVGIIFYSFKFWVGVYNAKHNKKNNNNLLVRLFFLVLSLIFILFASNKAAAGKIAIVIDDIGNRYSDQKLLAIDAPLNLCHSSAYPNGVRIRL